MARLLFFDVESMVENDETVNEPICVVVQFSGTGQEKLFKGLGLRDGILWMAIWTL